MIVEYSTSNQPAPHQNAHYDENVQLKYDQNGQMKISAGPIGHTTYVTLEPVNSQQPSQNYMTPPTNLHADGEYNNESPPYVNDSGAAAPSYVYSRSSTVDSNHSYAFYNKDTTTSEDENNASVVYMKSVNIPPEKLYSSMLSHDYEENHNQPNEQVIFTKFRI